MILKPEATAFSCAPSQALRPNSASAIAMAMVCGLGCCTSATLKKPRVKAGFGVGPFGIIEKYLGYLKLSLTPVPNRLTNSFFRPIAIGIAAAIWVEA